MDDKTLGHFWLNTVQALILGPHAVVVDDAIKVANTALDAYKNKFNGENNND